MSAPPFPPFFLILFEWGFAFIDIFSAANISAHWDAIDGDSAAGIAGPSGAFHGLCEALGVERALLCFWDIEDVGEEVGAGDTFDTFMAIA